MFEGAWGVMDCQAGFSVVRPVGVVQKAWCWALFIDVHIGSPFPAGSVVAQEPPS